MHTFLMIVWAAVYVATLSMIAESLFSKEWKNAFISVIVAVLLYYIPPMFGVDTVEMLKWTTEMM